MSSTISNSQNPSKPFLSRNEFADLIGVHPLTILRWENQFNIPRFQAGNGPVRYRREVVEQFIEDHHK